MYTPRYTQESRPEVMHQLMREHPFAALITTTPSGPDANHIPIELEASPAPFGTLMGHIARANPLWREHDFSRDALVIFQGPQTYITPNWYPSRHETGAVAPTWNYAVVHARGPMRIIEDPRWILAQIERLLEHHEAHQPAPWKVDDAPRDYIDRLLKAIVGFEIPIRTLTGKWKVSQNRRPEDRQGVIDGLIAQDTPTSRAMANLVREAKPDPEDD